MSRLLQAAKVCSGDDTAMYCHVLPLHAASAAFAARAARAARAAGAITTSAAGATTAMCCAPARCHDTAMSGLTTRRLPFWPAGMPAHYPPPPAYTDTTFPLPLLPAGTLT